ncbi:autophagy-related protein 13-like isoform X3 [Amphibalanus amphitrite]|uniref:autophagy-related protein 13-like isoform X3 n=1 Tax=Amphibalanus amphitrite TaxID=1232801 RepID=UPI001C929642|nr:autophagy-related protein 13-like isoform X3 [Amphibalanus amphitrite]
MSEQDQDSADVMTTSDAPDASTESGREVTPLDGPSTEIEPGTVDEIRSEVKPGHGKRYSDRRPAPKYKVLTMDCDRKEFENMVNIMCRKMAHIIVESRLGKKIHTPCKVHADVPDWFNLSLADMPEVVKEVKHLLLSSGGLWAAPVTSFCVEISLKTADGVSLVLEQWALTLDTSAPSGAKPPATVVNQLGVLLKSLLVTTRLTVGYKLSRQQSQESHIIFYKFYIGEPDLQGLGEASDRMAIGEVSTPVCTLNLTLYHRTKLAISAHSAQPIVMKSDHFKPEQSPRVRRVTGFAERRPRSVSDSVEMIGASSSSSSNMDTKTTGGSSTDSDQRRRVAAFADDPSEKPAPAGDVPFLRLVGEPPPPAAPAAGADVTMADGSAPPQPSAPPQRVVSDQPRPVAAAAALPAPGAAPPSPSADDFVMVELRTPFSEASSDSELGAFFRQWQAAPPLASLSGGEQGPPAAGAASPPPPADQQVVSLSEQLARFELKAQEFDEMIAQLDRQDGSKQ